MHFENEPRGVPRGRAFYRWLFFSDDRLEGPDGEILGRFGLVEGGAIGLVWAGSRERVHAKLACAYMRPFGEGALVAIEKAARDHAHGDPVLASIRLIHARLDHYDDPWAAAARSAEADRLLAKGFSPADLVRAAGLRKEYHAQERRVPAGSGRPSGRWTSGDEGDAPPPGLDPNDPALQAPPLTIHPAPPPSAFLPATAAAVSETSEVFAQDLSAQQIAGLNELAARFSVAALLFDVLFVPDSGASPVIRGKVPNSGFSYVWAKDEGSLTITDASGAVISAAHRAPNHVFYDDDLNAIARTTSSAIAIDWDQASEARANREGAAAYTPITNANETYSSRNERLKLCPDKSPDKPHGASEDANRYQEMVTGLPRGWAIFLNGVHYDGCRPSIGFMLETKAKFAQFLDENGHWYIWFRKGQELVD